MRSYHAELAVQQADWQPRWMPQGRPAIHGLVRTMIGQGGDDNAAVALPGDVLAAPRSFSRNMA